MTIRRAARSVVSRPLPGGGPRCGSRVASRRSASRVNSPTASQVSRSAAYMIKARPFVRFASMFASATSAIPLRGRQTDDAGRADLPAADPTSRTKGRTHLELVGLRHPALDRWPAPPAARVARTGTGRRARRSGTCRCTDGEVDIVRRQVDRHGARRVRQVPEDEGASLARRGGDGRCPRGGRSALTAERITSAVRSSSAAGMPPAPRPSIASPSSQRISGLARASPSVTYRSVGNSDRSMSARLGRASSAAEARR